MYDDELMHYGVKGMKLGVRRYQNADGSLTDKGKKRYGAEKNLTAKQVQKKLNRIERDNLKIAGKAMTSMYKTTRHVQGSKKFEKHRLNALKYADLGIKICKESQALQKMYKQKYNISSATNETVLNKGRIAVSALALGVTGPVVTGRIGYQKYKVRNK